MSDVERASSIRCFKKNKTKKTIKIKLKVEKNLHQTEKNTHWTGESTAGQNNNNSCTQINCSGKHFYKILLSMHLLL